MRSIPLLWSLTKPFLFCFLFRNLWYICEATVITFRLFWIHSNTLENFAYKYCCLICVGAWKTFDMANVWTVCIGKRILSYGLLCTHTENESVIVTIQIYTISNQYSTKLSNSFLCFCLFCVLKQREILCFFARSLFVVRSRVFWYFSLHFVHIFHVTLLAIETYGLWMRTSAVVWLEMCDSQLVFFISYHHCWL